MTNRKIVSDIRGTHRLLSSDGAINDRTILGVARNFALTFVNQSTNKRKLWSTDTIFTSIPCIEMDTISLGECCNYVGTKKVSRSKKKIPKIVDGNYQYVIKGVYDVGRSRSLTYLDVNRYINHLKLQLKNKDVFYWIEDGYLIVTEPDVKLVSLIAFFEEPPSPDILYPDCECSGALDPCISALDHEFKIPGNMISGVVAATSRFLLETYFRIPEDKTSDNKDDQTPNRA